MLKNGKGLDWSNHEVHTDDGYILNLFRLLPKGTKHGEVDDKVIQGKPVLMMHGLGGKGPGFVSSITNDVEDFDSLPIALVEQGYDVWLGNGRGTKISQEHETLDWLENESAYWDFSFPKLAQYDLTAMLGTISEETGGKKIQYIGYSLGTTEIFYAL